jgi:hypothetical protein
LRRWSETGQPFPRILNPSGFFLFREAKVSGKRWNISFLLLSHFSFLSVVGLFAMVWGFAQVVKDSNEWPMGFLEILLNG